MNAKHSLVFIEYFGKLSFCCPPGKANPNRNGMINKLHLLPAILWYTFVILIYIDPFKECLHKVTESIPLSSKIGYYIMSSTMLVSDTILRLAGVFHGSEMLRLLFTCKQRAANFSRLDLPQVAMLAGGIALSAFTGIVHNSIRVHVAHGIIPLLSDSEGPNVSRIIRRIIFIFADYSAASSIAFSILFVAIIGLSLLRWLKIWQTNFASLLSKTEYTRATLKIKTHVFGMKEAAAGSLHQEFLEIRESFEIYGKIAGIFSLGLLIDCTMNIINALTMMVPSKDDLEGNIDQYYSPIDHVRLAPMLIFICCFGNFIGNKIKMHRRELRELEMDNVGRVNASAAKTFNFVNEWTWKLTACDLFDINHARLPAILATIMTYFIFLFQLKSSEATCA